MPLLAEVSALPLSFWNETSEKFQGYKILGVFKYDTKKNRTHSVVKNYKWKIKVQKTKSNAYWRNWMLSCLYSGLQSSQSYHCEKRILKDGQFLYVDNKIFSTNLFQIFDRSFWYKQLSMRDSTELLRVRYKAYLQDAEEAVSLWLLS